MTEKKQKVCFVLGQHRSGTSAFTGLLNIFGASLGPGHVHEHDSWNQKGYFENKVFEEFNEAVLATFCKSWSAVDRIDRCDHFSEPWSSLFVKLQNLIREQAADNALTVIKDPRISLFVDLYCAVAHELKDEFDFSFIFSRRDVQENIKSIVKRGALGSSIDGKNIMDEDWARRIIYHHTTSFDIKFDKKMKFEYHTYSNLFYDIEKYFKQLDSSLDLGLQINDDTLARASEFLSKELKHHNSNKACKVIATYFGNRRRWPSGNEQTKNMWKNILRFEKKIDPGDAMDTLIVIHDHGDQDAIDYIMSLDGKPTRWGLIKTAVRPWEDGVGASFKSFDFAFKKWRDEYNSWIFDEDNVFIRAHGFLPVAKEQFAEDPNVAFLGMMRCDARDFSIVDGRIVGGRLFTPKERAAIPDIWHCHGGCGYTERAYLDEVVEKFGSLPYSNMKKPGEPGNGLSEEHPWYRSAEQDGEVMFTGVYHLLGYKICEIKYYSSITYYTYDNSYA